MAETNISVSQNQFACPVCLDLLRDPVTIPCGHSYCMGCIKDCWDQEDEKGSYSCPQCRQTFSPRPVAGRNPILAEMVEKLRMAGVEAAPFDLEEIGPGEVECTVCVGRKRKANKSCLECLASYCETHLNRHEELLSGKGHKVVEAVEHLEKRICLNHNKPLEVWCRTDQICVCLLCIIDQHKGHDIISASMAKTEKKRELSCSFNEEIKQRERELQELKQAEEPFKVSAAMVLSTNERIFTELIALVEKRRSELEEMIIAQEQTALSQVDQLERRLEQRVINLRQRVTDLDQVSYTEDPIHFLQSLPSLCLPQDLHKIIIGSHFGFVKTSVSELSRHVTDYLSKDFESLARKVKHTFVENVARDMTREELLPYFCQPKMDEDTAFRHHNISDKGTEIDWCHLPMYDKHNERFTDCRQVLCKEGLSGRHYWEVEWRAQGNSVSIAVSYKTIGREGTECGFGCNDQSWSLTCSRSILSFAHNNVKIDINKRATSTVGVYLDHKEGTLDFYSVSVQKMTLLHRVQTTFIQPLYPGFLVDCRTELKICKKLNIIR